MDPFSSNNKYRGTQLPVLFIFHLVSVPPFNPLVSLHRRGFTRSRDASDRPGIHNRYYHKDFGIPLDLIEHVYYPASIDSTL